MDDTISRQAAIDAIRKIYDSVGILGEKWAVDKCQMAIKDLPSAQPETSILTVTVNPDFEEIERVAREIKDAPLMVLPSAQPTIEAAPVRYCRECKWSKCHINVDKYGNAQTYWWCRNWDGGTDEEGYCHEWEAKMEDE